MSKKPLVLRNGDFCLLWISQVVSQAGNRMFQIAILWWILSRATGNSGKEIGIFMVMAALPSLVLVKWIGKVIDTNLSKRVLLTNDFFGIVTASLLALYFYFGGSSVLPVYGSALLFSLFQAFIEPTLSKAVPELVVKEDTESAVAFISSTGTLAYFAGAVMGAALIDRLGITWIVIINGGSYLVSFICDGIIKFQYRKKRDSKKEEESESTLNKGKEVGVFDKMPLLKKVLLSFALVNFFGTPIVIVLPVYVKTILQKDATLLGLLEACVWIGLLLGTFSSKYFGLREKTLKMVSLCIFVFGLGLLVPGLIVNQVAYAISLFSCGFFLGMMNVRLITMFQQVVADDMKGRFFAMLQAMVSFTMPISYFVFGAVLDVFPTTTICLIQGVGVVVLAVFYLFISDKESELRPCQAE